MTDVGDDGSSDSIALSIRSKASDWIISQQLSTEWSQEDQAGLDEWLAESSAHRLAYWRLEAAWKNAKRLTVLKPSRAPTPTVSRQWTSFRFVGAVATLAIAVTLAWFGLPYFAVPQGRVYETPLGGRMTISLGDGSKIELNTGTLLRLADDSVGRRATLERGEAYFQIRHDASRPFVVSVESHKVIDLGTKFSIRADQNRVKVALVEGSAKIETVDGETRSTSVVLKPGDVAVATETSLAITRKSIGDLNDSLAWRRDMVAFKFTTLADAAREFNRYNDTKIVIRDSRIAKLTIYGNFPTRDVAGFADAAQISLNLHVESRNGEILLSRGRANHK